MKEPINIVLCTDDNYAFCTSVAIWSVLRQTLAPVHVHIIGNDLSEHSLTLLDKTAAYFFGAHITFYRLPELPQIPQARSALKCTLSRLLIPSLTPHIPRMIYLDSDVLVLKDLTELYQTPLGGALAGAVKNLRTLEKQFVARSAFWALHPKSSKAARAERARLAGQLGIDAPEQYINAGVFLFDNDAIAREPGILSLLGDIRSASSVRRKDQDWLFRVFFDRMKYLHPRWNCYSTIRRAHFWAFDEEERQAYIEAKNDPGIVHFVGQKPWSKRRFEIAASDFTWRALWRQTATEMSNALAIDSPYQVKQRLPARSPLFGEPVNFAE